MAVGRRQFIVEVTSGLGVTSLVFAKPNEADAYLLGTWWLKCWYDDCDRIDRVDAGTKQHVCSKCNRQMFSGNSVHIACPRSDYAHINKSVDTGSGGMTSFKCRTCQEECRVPEAPQRREPPDRGGR